VPIRSWSSSELSRSDCASPTEISHRSCSSRSSVSAAVTVGRRAPTRWAINRCASGSVSLTSPSSRSQQLEHQEAPLSVLAYMGSADFWNRTLQNWQSEFLAVGSIAIFSVYLRQRGSTQSKPVGAPHTETSAEG